MKDLSDKKAIKKLIKRAKKHPNWYSEYELAYVKMLKKAKKQQPKLD